MLKIANVSRNYSSLYLCRRALWSKLLTMGPVLKVVSTRGLVFVLTVSGGST